MCHRRRPDYNGNCYLGIDLGEQYFSAVVLDAKMQVKFSARVNYDTDLPEYNTQRGIIQGSSIDEFFANPVMWVKALDILLNCLSTQGADLHSIAAIGGSAQQHGSVFWSDLGFRRLCGINPILRLHEQLTDTCFELNPTPVGADNSATRECFQMQKDVGGQNEMKSITGSKAYPSFVGPQIRKVFETCTEHYERTVRISLVTSFLSSLLIGSMGSIEFTDACGTSLLDLHSKTWSEKCLNACAPNLAQRLMKPIASNRLQGRIADYYVKRWNFRPDCMILSSITNTASAVVGLRFNKETDVVLSLGPIDKLIMHVENHPKQEEGHLLCDPINPNESFSLICFRNGSRVRDAICEQVAQGSWSTFSEMLKKTPMGNYGNVGLYFPVKETDPPASGTLRWDGKMDPMSHEAIHGCDEFERPEIEARAVIEGQMMHHRAMMKDMDFRFDENTRIIVLGDGSQNESLLQVIADVFNTPVYTHCGVEPALLGGAYRARYAFYEYREANCSCRRCRMASGRNPKLQFEDFFRNMPGALKLMAEPTAGCDVIYDRLTVRCMNMCQLLAASTSIHESHIVME
ncbi:uncharacterized protein Dwil_GK24427 [Drosophila willistoni]|uniref:Xylulose kinase n=2 Tax=Drosophila willistoni TaxID=7260 RepID=B4N0R9_DROWI|nr:uncharacterized protein Dwil_GK24427 [Drosophila willistoni]